MNIDKKVLKSLLSKKYICNNPIMYGKINTYLKYDELKIIKTWTGYRVEMYYKGKRISYLQINENLSIRDTITISELKGKMKLHIE